jgi:LCP family protein required for cell wall assembly
VSDDEPTGSPDQPRPDDSRASAPWERPWAVTPPAPPRADDTTAAGAPAGAEDDASRRSRDPDHGEQVSVADLLRRIGHRAGGRRRTGDQPTPGTTNPGTSTPAPRPSSDDDTTVLPAVVDGHAPLGGTPPAPVGGTPPAPVVRTPPRAAPPARTAPVRVAAGRFVPLSGSEPEPAAEAVPTRLQAKKSRRQRRTALAGRAAVALVAVLVFGVTGTAWSLLRYFDANVQTVQSLDQGSTAIQQPEKQLGDENFLLVGSDSRAGASGEIGAGTESQVAGARSDTTMLAHIPADRSRVVIVSFPRDLQVDLPACNRWDNDTATYTTEVVPPQQGVKLNEAYFEGGPKCITKMVQQLSGLNVNHFVGVDFAGFQSMVDAVGGVQVCTEKPLEDSLLGTVLGQAGTQRIDGQQALNYVRARHVVGDPTSDYGRIQRQQRFLSSLLRASLSTNTLLNVGKLKRLVDAVTSSTFGEGIGVQDLLTLGQSLQGLEPGRVTFITAPTTGEANSSGNEVLLDAANAALFQDIREGVPLPGEAAAPSTTGAPTTTVAPPSLAALAPADVSFVVRNATTTKGLAAAVADELTAYGLRASSLGDAIPAPNPPAPPTLGYNAGAQAAARTLASAVPGATLEPTPGLGTSVELVLGSDVRGTTTAPTAAGSPLPASGAAATSPVAPLPGNLAVVNGGDATCT